MYILYFIIILSSCLLLAYLLLNKYKNKYIKNKQKELDYMAHQIFQNSKADYEQILAALKKQCDNYEMEQRVNIDRQLEEIKQEKIKAINFQATVKQQMCKSETQDLIQKCRLEVENYRAKAGEEIKQLQQSVADFETKQKAINDEIIRRRKLNEQEDFHRVCLSDDAKADVALLQQIKQNLKKPEIVDKLIYDSYIAKPVLEMIKEFWKINLNLVFIKLLALKRKKIIQEKGLV